MYKNDNIKCPNCGHVLRNIVCQMMTSDFKCERCEKEYFVKHYYFDKEYTEKDLNDMDEWSRI